MVHTPADMREALPAFAIDFDEDSFKFEARPLVAEGPDAIRGTRGSLTKVLTYVASAQRWPQGDLDQTLAYNERT